MLCSRGKRYCAAEAKGAVQQRQKGCCAAEKVQNTDSHVFSCICAGLFPCITLNVNLNLQNLFYESITNATANIGKVSVIITRINLDMRTIIAMLEKT